MVNLPWTELIAIMLLSVALGFLFAALFFSNGDDDDLRG